MYPNADIPCIQISLVNTLDPKSHIEMGKALIALRKQNILILGSGMSFHNLSSLVSGDQESNRLNNNFQDWLLETCIGPDVTTEDRERRLIAWESAPSARFCHPREDHLMPLHVCFGASGGSQPDLVFDDTIMNKRVISLLWKE